MTEARPNPYARLLDRHDVLASLRQTPARIESLVRGWPRERDRESYAPGKWNAAQILMHLAQSELVFANRLRFALTQEAWVIAPFDQEAWMRVEPPALALDALDAYAAIRRLNVGLCASLDAAGRARPVHHPEFGAVTVEWIMIFFGGHERHHLPQIEAIAEGRVGRV